MTVIKGIRRVVVACEQSQSLTSALLSRGHEVISVDLLPGDKNLPHHQGDVVEYLESLCPGDVDDIVAFPPCTYLCKAQMWMQGRVSSRDKAVDFINYLWNYDCERVALENPVGFLNNNWLKPSQIISPHQFGDDYKKDICLWLRNFPELFTLVPFGEKHHRKVDNHCNGRMSRSQKSVIRSSWKFYPQLCNHIAESWF